MSQLALEAIKNGDMAVYGTHQNSEKLTVAFLDYVFQIAMYKKDPGLLRIMLHKGTTQDKFLALLISNAFLELKRHKVTMRFVELFHDCFMGKVPSRMQRIFIPRVYKPVFDEAYKIAKANTVPKEEMSDYYFQSINSISDKLNTILFDRLNIKLQKLFEKNNFENLNFISIIDNLEITDDIRSLMNVASDNKKKSPNLMKFLDGLSFPFLASSLILGANFTSAKVLYNNREMLKTFALKIGKLQHPKKMLWFTDTYGDKNGVSSVLKEMHSEIKKLNLPIDIIVCSNEVEPDKNLIVLKPLIEITLPFYKEQKICIPIFNEIHNLFHNNEYDRVMCSTEGIMGLVGLYLKKAYSVKAYFYVHTDWVMFARKVWGIDSSNLNRLRRILRAFYGGFDKLFVLNSDHKKWLMGREMEFDEEKVCQTAHWVDKRYYPRHQSKENIFDLNETDKVLLFVGRLSSEKGVFDIAEIYQNLISTMPDLKLVFAGSGPAQEELQKRVPQALFMGWVDNEKLAQIYSAADLLLLPSRFDTFGCVVLEAMSCGLPVVAYKSKGPKDIIKHLQCGYLVSSKKEMQYSIQDFFENKSAQERFSLAAINRSKDYSKHLIIKNLMHDTELA